MSNHRFRSTTLLIISLIVSAFGQGPGPGTPDLPLKSFRLRNGLRVILQPDANAREVSVEFWIHAGMSNEMPGKHGLAHFFEHATPYGLAGDETALASFRAQRTDSNAQTRRDYTRYFVQVKPNVLDLALQYSSDRFRADLAKITEASIEGHRKNVLAEFDRQEPSPFWGPTAEGTAMAGVFGSESPYGHSPYGTRQENENFTASDVRNWYSRYLFPSNALLFVVGHFDVGIVKLLITKHFGDLQGPVNIKSSPVRTTTTTTTGPASVTIPATNRFLFRLWNIPQYGHRDSDALELLSYILDERLARKVSSGSIINAGSSRLFAGYEHSGIFGIFAEFSDSSDREKVAGVLQSTLDNVLQEKVSQQELRVAYSRIIKKVNKEGEKLGFIESRTELIGEGMLFKGDPNFYIKRLDHQSRIKPPEIQRIAHKYLKRSGFLLTVEKHAS